MFAVKLTTEWAAWVAILAAPLHRRLAWRLPAVVVGILLASGRRKVASWWRAAGVGDRFRSSSYFLDSLGRKGVENVSGTENGFLRPMCPISVPDTLSALKAYQDSHDHDPIKVGEWREVRYRPDEGVVRPRTWDAADWFDKLVNAAMPMVPRGDKMKPQIPTAKFTIGNLVLSVGSGGLHSVDCPRVYYATKRHRLISVDVQSFYPSLISTKGIGPAAYSDTGRETYRAIVTLGAIHVSQVLESGRPRPLPLPLPWR